MSAKRQLENKTSVLSAKPKRNGFQTNDCLRFSLPKPSSGHTKHHERSRSINSLEHTSNTAVALLLSLSVHPASSCLFFLPPKTQSCKTLDQITK